MFLKRSFSFAGEEETKTKEEKCNAIDLSVDVKKLDKVPTKSESINDICSRLEKKCGKLKEKCPKQSEKSSPTRTLTLPPQNGGCSRTTPITFKHEPKTNMEVPPLLIKKEPSDFQKYSFANYLSPRGYDGQLLSPGRYPDSYPSPRLSATSDFLSPRIRDGPFLSPNIDVETHDASKRKTSEEPSKASIFLGEDTGKNQDGGSFLSPTSTTNIDEDEAMRNKSGRAQVAAVTPCQVAEVTSASSLLSPKIGSVVKQETAVSVSAASVSTPKDVAFTPPVQAAVVNGGTFTLYVNHVEPSFPVSLILLLFQVRTFPSA